MTLVQIYNNLADLVDFGLIFWPLMTTLLWSRGGKILRFLYFRNQWVKTVLMICNMFIFKQFHFLPCGSPRGYPLVRGRSYIQWCPVGVKKRFFSVWSRFRHVKKIFDFFNMAPGFSIFFFWAPTSHIDLPEFPSVQKLFLLV